MSLDQSPPLALVPPVALPLTPPAATNMRTTGQTPAATPSTSAGISPDPSAQTPAAGTPSESFNVADSAANDPDAHVVDMTDETYAIIVGHRITLTMSPNSSHTTVLQTLSTALLIRIPPTAPTADPYNASEVLAPDHAPCLAVHLLHARPRNAAKNVILPAGAANAAIDTPPSTPGATNNSNGSSTTSADLVLVPKAASDNILREAVTYLRNLALLAKVRGIKDGMTGLVPWHVLVTQRAVDGLDSVYGTKSWTIP